MGMQVSLLLIFCVFDHDLLLLVIELWDLKRHFEACSLPLTTSCLYDILEEVLD